MEEDERKKTNKIETFSNLLKVGGTFGVDIALEY